MKASGDGFLVTSGAGTSLMPEQAWHHRQCDYTALVVMA
jgi:hypothetical protein